MTISKINPYSNLILLEKKRFVKGLKIGILLTVPLWSIIIYSLNYFLHHVL